MDDNLEKFIKSHRAEMDGETPGRDLWAGIEKNLNQGAKQRHISKSVIFWRAAAVILLVISSWLAVDKVIKNSENNENVKVAGANPQFLEAETYYTSLIDIKREEIKTMSAKYDFGDDFLYEIDMLDSMYVTLKEDLKNGDEEYLVDAMILNLQLRIKVLNQQLRIIQSIEKRQKDEGVIL